MFRDVPSWVCDALFGPSQTNNVTHQPFRLRIHMAEPGAAALHVAMDVPAMAAEQSAQLRQEAASPVDTNMMSSLNYLSLARMVGGCAARPYAVLFGTRRAPCACCVSLRVWRAGAGPRVALACGAGLPGGVHPEAGPRPRSACARVRHTAIKERRT